MLAELPFNDNAAYQAFLQSSRVDQTAIVAAARAESEQFCEFLLTDEETGERVTMAEHQGEWHDLLAIENKLVLWAFPESGKTQQISIGYIIWRLGKNPRERWAILSATERQSKKIVGTIAQHITQNPWVHRVFPHLKRGRMWTDTAIEVERPYGIKDPSVQCTSPDVANIQGSRLDGLVLDDVLTENNTRTSYQRKKLSQWIRSSVMSRLTQGAPVIVLANAFHPEDYAHELEREGWRAERYPVLDADGNPTYPDRWPMPRIIEARDMLYGPREFERQMMCRALDESSARFHSDWVNTCKQRGEGYRLYNSLHDLITAEEEVLRPLLRAATLDRLQGLPDTFTVTGVDLGVSRKKGSDLTVLFTLLVWPDGSRQPVNIQAGRWSGAEILRRVVHTHEQWQSVVLIENNAAQDYLLQWLRKENLRVPVKAFTTTGRNKLNPTFGVESLATEMARGAWVIPCAMDTLQCEPEVQEWINEMLYYDPAAHTGDRLMASWIAREGARRLDPAQRKAKGSVGMRVITGARPTASA